ncbi:hypothetical protein ACVNNN_07775 [Lysinibacillus fusiformis]|uniref:hypothetical protein n=1 Tax=Lysinibacillus sp. PWR01 TaxID=3342384 RepID=UPI00372CFB84
MEGLKLKVLEDIKKTGFPFELKVAKKFEDLKWRVLHSLYYIDKDQNIGREVDLKCHKHMSQFSDDRDCLEYTYNMVVEIKQSKEKPWVFFTSDDKRILFPGHLAKNKSANKLQEEMGYDTIEISTLRKRELYHKTTAKSSYIALSSNKRDDIYKALSTSVKALVHFKETCYATLDNSDNGDLLFESFNPVVIVDGELYEAYLTEEDEVEIKDSKYIQVAFNYVSPNYFSSVDEDNNEFLVHVVHFDYLEQFIVDFEKLHSTKIFNKLKKKINKLMGKDAFK